jgi:hypothetical protein
MPAALYPAQPYALALMQDRMPREPPCPWQVLGLTVVHAVTVFVPPPGRSMHFVKNEWQVDFRIRVKRWSADQPGLSPLAIDWRNCAQTLPLCLCLDAAAGGGELCLAFSGRGQGRAAKGSADAVRGSGSLS